jgi:hypothetical protein
MGIGLEQLADGSVSDRNFQALAQLVLDTGGKSLGIRFGTGSATWSASQVSGAVTVTHGLGASPALVIVQQINTTAITYGNITTSSTTFSVTGNYTDHASGNLTGTFGFWWLVIG